MIQVDETIWMTFALCPNHILCKNTLENQFQYSSYQKLIVKRHLLNKKSTLHSRPRKVVFFLSSIPITSLSCLVMIEVDEIIWMTFALCPNKTFC